MSREFSSASSDSQHPKSNLRSILNGGLSNNPSRRQSAKLFHLLQKERSRLSNFKDQKHGKSRNTNVTFQLEQTNFTSQQQHLPYTSYLQSSQNNGTVLKHHSQFRSPQKKRLSQTYQVKVSGYSVEASPQMVREQNDTVQEVMYRTATGDRGLGRQNSLLLISSQKSVKFSTGDMPKQNQGKMRLKPSQVRFKVMQPYRTNMKYIVALDPLKLGKYQKEFQEEVLKYSLSGDIVPTPQVVKSLVPPKRDFHSIKESAVLIRSNPRKYLKQVPILGSNHALPPKPYKFVDRSLVKNYPKLNLPQAESNSSSSKATSHRSNLLIASSRVQSQMSSNREVEEECKGIQKDLRKLKRQLEEGLAEKDGKLKQMDKEIEYMQRIADISQAIDKVISLGVDETLFAQAMDRDQIDFLKLREATAEIGSFIEFEDKEKDKWMVRKLLALNRQQMHQLQMCYKNTSKLKKQILKDKKEVNLEQINRGYLEMLEQCLQKAMEQEKRIYQIHLEKDADSKELIDKGLYICKDDVKNPLSAVQYEISNEQNSFIEKVRQDEDQFQQMVKMFLSRKLHSRTLQLKSVKKLKHDSSLPLHDKRNPLKQSRASKERKLDQMLTVLDAPLKMPLISEQQDLNEKEIALSQNAIYRVINKKILMYLQQRPSQIQPSSLSLGVTVENLCLNYNYFDSKRNSERDQLIERLLQRINTT